MRACLTAVLAAGFLAALIGLAPLAASANGGSPTIGGPLLASHGVVEQPSSGVPPLPPKSALPASSWLVADLSTGAVLAAKDPHGKFLPASTLKTLTALTLLPKLRGHAPVMATNADASVDGSRVGLVPGHPYSMRQLFTSMLVVSANDAANALASAAGGIPTTLRLMNAQARHLQAFDTFARTPSGLDGHDESSSAYDLALIARADYAIPAFRRYVQTVKSRMPAAHHKHFQIYTHNFLLTSYRGDIGGKNGYTVAAQGTYVGAATRGGHTIVVSLMHANPNFWPMARALLNWGFAADGRTTPVGQLVEPLQPGVTPPPSAPPTPEQQLAAAHHQHGRSESPLELVLVAITVVVATITALRRSRYRRRSRRLRLPRAY
jgi:D-alanyl-D-alanine carboxypeptidase (penicillin-binding protein 5/6)